MLWETYSGQKLDLRIDESFPEFNNDQAAVPILDNPLQQLRMHLIIRGAPLVTITAAVHWRQTFTNA
jgi:hypothetical protein